MKRTVETVTVFVYGTLMRDEHNHALLATAKFIGAAKTEPCFNLYNMGHFPAMAEDGETEVAGEIYEVDAATLARLDKLEGHPVWYRRKSILLADGQRVLTYLMPSEKLDGRPEIIHGDWRLHRKELNK